MKTLYEPKVDESKVVTDKLSDLERNLTQEEISAVLERIEIGKRSIQQRIDSNYSQVTDHIPFTYTGALNQQQWSKLGISYNDLHLLQRSENSAKILAMLLDELTLSIYEEFTSKLDSIEITKDEILRLKAEGISSTTRYSKYTNERVSMQDNTEDMKRLYIILRDFKPITEVPIDKQLFILGLPDLYTIFSQMHDLNYFYSEHKEAIAQIYKNQADFDYYELIANCVYMPMIPVVNTLQTESRTVTDLYANMLLKITANLSVLCNMHKESLKQIES